MSQVCPECSTTFNNPKRSYCSDACHREKRRRRDRERQARLYEKEKRTRVKHSVEAECPNCGKDFRRNSSSHLYCSIKCRNANQKERDRTRGERTIASEPQQDRLDEINDLLANLPRDASPVYKSYLLERRAKWAS